MPGGPSRPVLILGLDGATFDLLDPLAALGDLPVLGTMMAGGARGVLRSVVPPITPAAWASFLTGKGPGRHGIFDFHVFDPRTRADAFVTSRALRERTLWELATTAGLRVGVVGLPLMYPPNPRAGTVVAGFDAPSVRSPFTAPPELREAILAAMPDYALSAVSAVSDPTLRTAGAFDELLAAVERSFEQRTRVALDLLRDGRWDLFMLHHQDTDALQHRVWQVFAQRAADPERWDRLRRVYRRLDALVGDVRAAMPAETLVLVVSDHGFGGHAGRVHPNRVLADLGYLRRRRRGRRARFLRSLRKRLVRLGLSRAATPARDPGTWIALARERSFGAVLRLDWRRTRAYVAMAEIYGLLFLNRRGREPRGIVAPGAEAERLCEELRARLLAYRAPGDAEPVFRAVLPGDAVYPEDPFGRRPDLVLVPRSGFSMTRDLAAVPLEVFAEPSGTHRPDGILLAAGAGVRPGALPGGADLVDVAPTVLAALGLPVPCDMEGRVLAELFLEPPDVRMGPPTEPVDTTGAALADAEEDEVVRRLQALGYAG